MSTASLPAARGRAGLLGATRRRPTLPELTVSDLARLAQPVEEPPERSPRAVRLAVLITGFATLGLLAFEAATYRAPGREAPVVRPALLVAATGSDLAEAPPVAAGQPTAQPPAPPALDMEEF